MSNKLPFRHLHRNQQFLGKGDRVLRAHAMLMVDQMRAARVEGVSPLPPGGSDALAVDPVTSRKDRCFPYLEKIIDFEVKHPGEGLEVYSRMATKEWALANLPT